MKETTSLPLTIGPQELLYQDKFQRVYRIVAEFDGFAKEYYVSERGQRAGLLVVQRGEEVLLVKQYRLLINGLSLEIPGGKVDEGETPEDAARRECLEETGVRPFNLKPLLSYQPGLDTLKNQTHIYYAEESEEIAEDNLNRRVWLPLERCLAMVFGQQISDSLSIVALLAYHALRVRQAR